MDGQAVAAQLMARADAARGCVGGTVDVGGPGPAPHDAAPARREGRRGLLGAAVPLAEQARLLERLGFGVARRAATASTSPCRTSAATTSRARPT